MFRTPEEESECPMCKRHALTRPTRFANSEGHPYAAFVVGGVRHEYRVGHCRVCTSCGHVALMLRPTELEKLRQELGEWGGDPVP